MDYEKLHKDTIANLQEMVNSGKITVEIARSICADFVPESENEVMIKFIKNQLFNIKKTITENYELDAKLTNAIDWLEKQGKHAKFLNSIQVGDKVTRNEDGVLVNLSQLKRVAKKNEKQDEQKCTCQLNNLKSNIRFPFKAKVKSSGAIVTIHSGQLSPDGKEWIKYQSIKEDGYKIYNPNNLELVCEVEPKFHEGDWITIKE